MTPDDVKARAVEVLAMHQARPVGSPHCACGWRPAMYLNDTDSDRQQHRYHQADTLATLGLLVDPDALGRAKAEALRERIFSLSLQWLRDQADYPDTEQGRAAAAAVRLCGREMLAALDPEEPR